jgi:putative phosphoribosyl transferase
MRTEEAFMPVIAADFTTTSVRIPIASRTPLHADMTTPADAKGLVLFANGSGSSRHSPRNRFVASELNAAGLATVLADLLTDEEEKIDDRTAMLRSDIPLLTSRLVQMIDWAREHDFTGALPIGIFGVSTGAAAALDAAAMRPDVVRAVVSRGGRPDLATHLAAVTAPTLLIVGGNDSVVLDLNQRAARVLRCPSELTIVPGAKHLFEEPGTIERVASAATAWFGRYLTHGNEDRKES